MKPLAIFDLDETLYTSKEFNDIFYISILKCIQRSKNCSKQKARELFKTTREKHEKQYNEHLGSTQTLYLYFNVSINDFEKCKIDTIRKHRIPELNSKKRNKKLKKALKQLSKKYVLILITNNHKSAAKIILRQLKLHKVFKEISTLNDMPDKLAAHRKNPDKEMSDIDREIISYIKPSEKRIVNILEKYNVRPKDCVSIGDRYYIDNVIADKMGMKTILVDSVDDTIKACNDLLEG